MLEEQMSRWADENEENGESRWERVTEEREDYRIYGRREKLWVD